MNTGPISQRRRTVTAGILAVALASAVSACGNGSSNDDDKGKPVASHGAQEASHSEQTDDNKVVATLKGAVGIVLDVTSATRSSGGFVTVNGNLKNTAGEDFYETSPWSGPELAVKAAGASLGGATLVDEPGKKRYYTLRDTENRPLVTVGISIVRAHSTQKVFMQFPAPPKGTTQVDLQIPTFQSATLKLTDM